jgi:hypothetical protein
MILTPMKSAVQPVAVSEQKMKEEFLKKQQELIELQKLKPKLEMLLQKQRQLGRSLIHIKPELVNINFCLKINTLFF